MQLRRMNSYPPTWTAESSGNQLEEIVDWQRKVLFPKHHLEIPQRNEKSFSSIERKVGLRSYSAIESTEKLEFAAVFAGRNGTFLERFHPGYPKKYLPAQVVEQRNGYYRIDTATPVSPFFCVQTWICQTGTQE